MPLYEFVCGCGKREMLVHKDSIPSLLCARCGQGLSKVPSRMSIRVPGPKPLNTPQNHALYREIVDETMWIGRKMAEEQGEPAGEHGCAVLPRAMGRAILAAHETFEKGPTDDS